MSVPGKSFNHPGLMQSYGAPFVPTDFIGTAGKIFWVGNRTGLPAGNGSSPDYPCSTLNGALAKCTSGRGDIVYVLPGHAESISAADAWSNLVAGTKIIGLGDLGADAPTFTWTDAAGTILANVANCRLQNLNLYMAGSLTSTSALTVTVGIVGTAAGWKVIGCNINVAVDADQLCTTGITLAAGCDDWTFANNEIWGGTVGTITGVCVTTGAVDRLKIVGNDVRACATAQLFDLSQAAITDNLILNNTMQNKLDTTTAVIKPHATSTGIVQNNMWFTAAGGTAPDSSGFTTYTTTYWFGLNLCSTVSAKTAILSPGVDA
jgi:hypothetical protein